MKTRIMYFESVGQGAVGAPRIGRATFSKSGRTLRYRDRSFRSVGGISTNTLFVCVETREQFCIRPPRADGVETCHRTGHAVEIDDDAREEYWTQVRGRPEWKERTRA